MINNFNLSSGKSSGEIDRLLTDEKRKILTIPFFLLTFSNRTISVALRLHPDNKMYRCNLDSPNACAPKVIATFNSCDEESEKDNEDFEYDTFGGTAGEGIAEHHTVGCTLLPEVSVSVD